MLTSEEGSKDTNFGEGRNMELLKYIPLALRGCPAYGKLTGREESAAAERIPGFSPVYVAHRPA